LRFPKKNCKKTSYDHKVFRVEQHATKTVGQGRQRRTRRSKNHGHKTAGLPGRRGKRGASRQTKCDKRIGTQHCVGKNRNLRKTKRQAKQGRQTDCLSLGVDEEARAHPPFRNYGKNRMQEGCQKTSKQPGNDMTRGGRVDPEPFRDINMRNDGLAHCRVAETTKKFPSGMITRQQDTKKRESEQ